MTAPSFAYRPALDGVRAAAVTAVVLYHLDYGWARGGFLGVDAFFVLSGYLISSLLLAEYEQSGTIALPPFWLRRTKRLLPALLLLLVGVGLYAAFAASTDRLDSLRADSIASLFYVANWRFVFAEASYFDLFSEASPLRHVWSLAIEEQFYLAWPLVVFGALRLGRGNRRLFAMLVAGAAVGSAALMAILFAAGDPSRAYYGTDTRVHQLLVGAALALVLPRILRSDAGRRAIGRVGLVAGALVLAAFGAASATGSGYYHGGSVAFAVVAAVLIAAASEAPASLVVRGLSVAPLRWVGRVSYGLYLWHWPMIVWLTPARAGVDGVALDLLRVAATVAATAASYYVLERPIRTDAIARTVFVPVAPLAVGLCAVFLVGMTAGATRNPLAAQTVFALPAPLPTSMADGGPVPTFAVVGDSVAQSIAHGLQTSPATPWPISSMALPGCGIAAGVAMEPDGTTWEPSITCRREVARLHRSLVERDRPDIVIWYSDWELSDRRIDGRLARFGSAAHRHELEADLRAAYERLSAGGAHVVFLLTAPRTEGDRRDPDVDWDARAAAYDALLRELAAEHAARTTVIDLPDIVCPAGTPCPPEVDGLRLRPDGAHFSDAGAEWLARRLAPALRAVRAERTAAFAAGSDEDALLGSLDPDHRQGAAQS